jgi:hypothetical protein
MISTDLDAPQRGQAVHQAQDIELSRWTMAWQTTVPSVDMSLVSQKGIGPPCKGSLRCRFFAPCFLISALYQLT